MKIHERLMAMAVIDRIPEAVALVTELLGKINISEMSETDVDLIKKVLDMDKKKRKK